MQVTLHDIAKQYNCRYLFKNVNFVFSSNHTYGIIGENGSGKSTLLKIIASYLLPSKGMVIYTLHNQNLDAGVLHKHLSIAAPYMQLPLDLELDVFLNIHYTLKPSLLVQNIDDWMEWCNLTEHRRKKIGVFSSGMIQRLKIGLAFFSDASLILLDEPASNLDQINTDWYQNMLQKFHKQKTILICTNHPSMELPVYDEIIEIKQWS